MTTTLIAKIDELLEDEKNLSTRSGLQLSMQALKEAMEFINEEKRARVASEMREIKITSTVERLVKEVEVIQGKLEVVYPFYRAGIWVANVIGILIAGLIFKLLFP